MYRHGMCPDLSFKQVLRIVGQCYAGCMLGHLQEERAGKSDEELPECSTT
jgi:hypothetical protein